MAEYYQNCLESSKFKSPTKKEKLEYEELHKYEGGFRYCTPITPRDETLMFVKNKLQKEMNKRTCNIKITTFMPAVLFESVFPPYELPFGWKRYRSSGSRTSSVDGGTEIIKVSCNFKSLNYLFGDKWLLKRFNGGVALCFRPYKGVLITRKPDGIVKINIKYFLKSQEGHIMKS